MRSHRTMLRTIQNAERTAEKTGMVNSRAALVTIRKEIEKFTGCSDATYGPPSIRTFAANTLMRVLFLGEVKKLIPATISVVNEERAEITDRIERSRYSHPALLVECSILQPWESGRTGVDVHELPIEQYFNPIMYLNKLSSMFDPGTVFQDHIPAGTMLNRIDKASRKIRKTLHEIGFAVSPSNPP